MARTKDEPQTRSMPELQPGDRLTRAEFERRYQAMPHLKKAELIEGVVHIPSPVNDASHGGPHADIMGWLAVYRAFTPGVRAGDNSTIRLDLANEPQPDAHLRILPAHGGQTRDEDGYIGGAPELVFEVAASSVSYDLHDKQPVYRRNAVREFVVWRTLDGEIDWFVLVEERFVRQHPGPGGILKSQVFPGLWLDPDALRRGDLRRVLEVLHQGLSTPEHEAFVARLGG